MASGGIGSRSAVIVEAVRSPIGRGKAGGALAELHPVDLLAQILHALIERSGIDPVRVDDVVTGCVSQVGEQSGTPGRWAWLAAGLPESVPSVTIDRRCGSSLQSVQFAAQAIMSGAQEVVVAAGVESMSRVPMGSNRAGRNPFGSAARRYAPGLVPQGVSAELVGARWGISRERADAYAVRSHARAHARASAGGFDAEIQPVRVGDVTVERDETIRAGTSADALAGLYPVFASDEAAERFPEITWSVTAGNSSQLADGAAALLITSESFAQREGLRPIARYVDGVLAAEDPLLMLTAPIAATRRLLDRTRQSLDDIAHYEVNEAFATVPLAWADDLAADEERLNPHGGAIALGHPLGASGARLATTALHAIREGAPSALVTMCEAGGMANALLLVEP